MKTTRCSSTIRSFLLAALGIFSQIGCGSGDSNRNTNTIPSAPGTAGNSANTDAGNGGATATASAGNASSGGGGSSGLGTGASSAGAASSSEPPGIQYFGRRDRSDPQNLAGSWGPIGIKAKFEGTSVRIKISDAMNTFTYSIDDGEPKTLGPISESEPTLASGLADGVHRLSFFRRSEGGYGKTVIHGLTLDPGKNVLSPDPRPPHKLEVVGDSISAGFGDEGMGGSTPAIQNGYLAYGPQLARMLDAEWSIIAHSGQGMYRNLCEALPPTASHMPDEFKLTEHPAVAGPSWDFSSWQPDVLIITLGTNDFADYPAGSCAPPSDDAFKGAYRGFLRFARESYAHAEIFALGTFIATSGNQFGTCNQDICAAVSELADPHVHCIDPSTGADGMWLIGPGDYIGDWTHPTVAGHTKLATKLSQIIKPIMGW